MREAMRGLAQGIVASYDNRVMGIASIRRDVSAQRERDQRHVQELHATRREAARTLRGHLARGRADLRAGVSAQLQELDRAHNIMARHQREGLAKGHSDVALAERQRKSDVKTWMEGVASAHQAMAQGLRADLSKGHADLRAGVSAQLQELDRAHNIMARHQREGLAKGHSDVALAERQRKSDVKTWMEGVASVHSAAREEWQNLAGTMRAKRAGGVAEAPAPRPPMEALRDRAFTYLADHPDGVQFLEVEREFRLTSQEASQLLRSLVGEGKARRENRLYFAT